MLVLVVWVLVVLVMLPSLLPPSLSLLVVLEVGVFFFVAVYAAAVVVKRWCFLFHWFGLFTALRAAIGHHSERWQSEHTVTLTRTDLPCRLRGMPA